MNTNEGMSDLISCQSGELESHFYKSDETSQIANSFEESGKHS